MRVFWPVTLAAASPRRPARVRRVLQGVGTRRSTRRSRTVSGPSLLWASLPALGGRAGTCSLADYKGKVVVLKRVGVLVRSLPRGDAAAADDARADRGPGRRSCSASTRRTRPASALDFLKRASRLTFPSLRDRDRAYGREFGVTGYPETFLIDRQGRVAALQRVPGRRRRGWTSTCRSCWRRRREGRARSPSSPRWRSPRRAAGPAGLAARHRGRGDVRRVRDACSSVSNSPVADREREFIRRRIADGMTKQQIKRRWSPNTGATGCSPRPRAPARTPR